MEKPVYDSPEAVQPLHKGEIAPGGTVLDLDGKACDLGDLFAKKPTVLIFYRGGWCPFCSAQMGQLTKLEPELESLGYQIIAVTPDQPESLRASLGAQKPSYTLLSDSPMTVTRSYGLAYQVPPAMLEAMKGFGVDLDKATGNSLHQLPVPAAFVVDTRGVIHFVYYNADIKIRVAPEALLEAAREAKK